MAMVDMDSATDTDSEVDHPSTVLPYSTALSPSLRLPVPANGSSLKEVQAALWVLQSVETRLLAKVFSTLAQSKLV